MIRFAADTVWAVLALIGLVTVVNHVSGLGRQLNSWHQRHGQRQWRAMGRKFRGSHRTQFSDGMRAKRY